MNQHVTRDMRQDVGGRWARALAARDAAALKALLRADVDFRATTPGRFWESRDAEAVVDDTILGTWFAPEKGTIELLAVECSGVGPLQRVRYQLGVTGAHGTSLVEQVAYVRTDEGRISSLRVLCSGYLTAADPSMSTRAAGDIGGRKA